MNDYKELITNLSNAKVIMENNINNENIDFEDWSYKLEKMIDMLVFTFKDQNDK